MMTKLCLFFVLALFGGTSIGASPTQGPGAKHLGDIRVKHAEVPDYPEIARTARISGTVEVEITVKDGAVSNAKVKSGPRMLARAALENIKTWVFYSSANTTIVSTFIYRLSTGQSVDPQNPTVELQLPLMVRITAAPVVLHTR